MKNLINKYPTLFGSVLLLGIICAVYLGFCALGLVIVWAVDHFQLAIPLPPGNTQTTSLLLYMPKVGVYFLSMLAFAVIVVGAVSALVITFSVAIQHSTKSLGAWLSAKQGGSGVAK